MTSLPFAALVLEREPPTWSGLPLESYVQVVGGFAFVLLLIALLATSFRALRAPKDRASLGATLFFLAVAVAFTAYFALLLLWSPNLLVRVTSVLSGEAPRLVRPTGVMALLERICLDVGGAAAVLAVCVPFLGGLGNIRLRR